jgi:hypothetical protein
MTTDPVSRKECGVLCFQAAIQDTLGRDKIMKRISIVLAALLIIGLWCLCNIAFADLYTYVDSDGIIHLTNTPDDPRFPYVLIFKETPRPSEPSSAVQTNSAPAKPKRQSPAKDIPKRKITDSHEEIQKIYVPIDIAGEKTKTDEPGRFLLLVARCVVVLGGVAFILFRFITIKKKARNASKEHHKDESQEEANKSDNQRDEQYNRSRREDDHSSAQTRDTQTEDQRYEHVLGLKGKVAASDIRKAYREMLAKYHPDKVNHLGDEFIRIAEQKTREIIAAYEYFCKKYDIS